MECLVGFSDSGRPCDYVFCFSIFQWNLIQEYLKCVLYLTLCLRWEGEGCSEVGKDASNGNVLVAVDPKFYRPTEVVSYYVHGWERSSPVEVLLMLPFKPHSVKVTVDLLGCLRRIIRMRVAYVKTVEKYIQTQNWVYLLNWIACLPARTYDQTNCTMSNSRRERQRQRHKSMIWLVEWRKIIVLHVRHAFCCNVLTYSAKRPREIFIFEVLTTTRAPSSKSFTLCLYMKTIPTTQAKVQFACFVQRDQHGIIAKYVT